MQKVHRSLFARPDTFFGICEGLGEDFRFNPLILRLALTLLLFFQPVAALSTYAALGVLVLASRLLVPNPRVAARPEACASRAPEQPEARTGTEPVLESLAA